MATAGHLAGRHVRLDPTSVDSPMSSVGSSSRVVNSQVHIESPAACSASRFVGRRLTRLSMLFQLDSPNHRMPQCPSSASLSLLLLCVRVTYNIGLLISPTSALNVRWIWSNNYSSSMWKQREKKENFVVGFVALPSDCSPRRFQ